MVTPHHLSYFATSRRTVFSSARRLHEVGIFPTHKTHCLAALTASAVRSIVEDGQGLRAFEPCRMLSHRKGQNQGFPRVEPHEQQGCECRDRPDELATPTSNPNPLPCLVASPRPFHVFMALQHDYYDYDRPFAEPTSFLLLLRFLHRAAGHNAGRVLSPGIHHRIADEQTDCINTCGQGATPKGSATLQPILECSLSGHTTVPTPRSGILSHALPNPSTPRACAPMDNTIETESEREHPICLIRWTFRSLCEPDGNGHSTSVPPIQANPSCHWRC